MDGLGDVRHRTYLGRQLGRVRIEDHQSLTVLDRDTSVSAVPDATHDARREQDHGQATAPQAE
jgi:hypothetical protein